MTIQQLGEEQQHFIKKALEFVKTKNNNYISLIGAAGTGKSWKNKIFGGLDMQRIPTNFYDETTALSVFGVINE